MYWYLMFKLHDSRCAVQIRHIVSLFIVLYVSENEKRRFKSSAAVRHENDAVSE